MSKIGIISTLLLFVTSSTLAQLEVGGGTIVGGSSAVPIDDEIKDLAWTATEKFNTESNAFHHFVPTVIFRAESQVVSGTLKRIQVLMSQTQCTKSSVEASAVRGSSCETVENGKVHICEMRIWSQPWLNRQDITNKCKVLDVAKVLKDDDEPVPTPIGSPPATAPDASKTTDMGNLRQELREREQRIYERLDEMAAKCEGDD